MDKRIRKDLSEVLKIMGRDMTLSFTDIKRGWHIWKKIRAAGFDLNSYLEINSIPRARLTEKRLISFLENKEYVFMFLVVD